MENTNDEIINKKLRIMTAVKKIKEEIALHGHKNTKREIIFFEKAIKFHEQLANDEGEDDIMYLNDRIISFENLFHDYFIKNNTNDQMSEKPIANNSTFIKTPEWLALKRSLLNPKNNDNKCFQYSITLSLYHEQFGKTYCRIPKIKQYTDNFNWENINFPPQEQDYETYDMNNKSMSLHILQVNEQKISHLYKSEFNKTREKQAILLILADDQKQRHVAVRNFKLFVKRQK